MKLALTCGDPAGVGPEIVATYLRENLNQASDVCAVGPRAWAEGLAEEVGCEALPVGPKDYRIHPGQPSVDGAKLAFEALEAAAASCLAGTIHAVVTAPVSKIWMQRAGFTFPGQTEFFGARWEGDPVMAFAGEELRVVLATWHIPLMQVMNQLDFLQMERAVDAAAMLASSLSKGAARIGVCGLNPHAGEGGLLGDEEHKIIDPWLEQLRERHPGLSACLPADTVFWRQRQGDFDAVIALYHDQGLGPVKTLEFDSAVNVTLGLSHIRTSPDHGTAFGIAGKGVASPRSFASACRLAQQLVNA